MTFSNTFENEILDAMLGEAEILGSTLQIALSTTDPLEDGSGLSEPSGNGYARVSVGNNSTYWNVASGGQKTNKIDIVFPEATGSWGIITHWAILDNGNFKIYGLITDSSGNAAPITVVNLDTVRFLAGRLKITLD